MTKTETVPPTADEVLQILIDGNKRFVTEKMLHQNHSKSRRDELKDGQQPIATILTCSDSRVPPVDIFDQGLGDLFVVRVAGNIAGDHALGSIEYGVAHLHTPLVIIMGHGSCGAIAAVASGATLEGHIATLTPTIQAALKNVKETEKDRINLAAKELAKQVAERVATSEPVIADLVHSGKTRVIPAYYDFETGKVSFLT